MQGSLVMTDTTPVASGRQPDQAALGQRAIYVAMAGLMLGMLLAMLDNLIVSTALPTIVGDLGGLAHLSWVVTGYALAAAASKDRFGEKRGGRVGGGGGGGER